MIGKRAKMGAWGDPPNFVAPVRGNVLGGCRAAAGPQNPSSCCAAGTRSRPRHSGCSMGELPACLHLLRHSLHTDSPHVHTYTRTCQPTPPRASPVRAEGAVSSRGLATWASPLGATCGLRTSSAPREPAQPAPAAAAPPCDGNASAAKAKPPAAAAGSDVPRVNIGVFGVMNAGKSTLINALTRQVGGLGVGTCMYLRVLGGGCQAASADRCAQPTHPPPPLTPPPHTHTHARSHARVHAQPNPPPTHHHRHTRRRCPSWTPPPTRMHTRARAQTHSHACKQHTPANARMHTPGDVHRGRHPRDHRRRQDGPHGAARHWAGKALRHGGRGRGRCVQDFSWASCSRLQVAWVTHLHSITCHAYFNISSIVSSSILSCYHRPQAAWARRSGARRCRRSRRATWRS